jgi:hypothetical protein
MIISQLKQKIFFDLLTTSYFNSLTKYFKLIIYKLYMYFEYIID